MQRPHNKKAYPTWSIRMEIAAMDEILPALTLVAKYWVSGDRWREKDTKQKYTVGLEETMALEMSDSETLILWREYFGTVTRT